LTTETNSNSLDDHSPGIIKLSTNQLLEAILAALEDYRLTNHLPEYQTFNIDASTIARKIIYDRFEASVGFTFHPSWTNIYSRVQYFLEKVEADKKEANYSTL